MGVGGEQVSTTNNRKPFFPIQSAAEDSAGLSETDNLLTILDPIRMRHLSACEEESEIDEVLLESSMTRSQSPLHSPRSRRLLSARSSPNIAKSISRSDFSDDEDDDIMELSSHVRPHPSTRHSPLASPHLSSSRLSPTHSYGYSSDEETHVVYDGRRKRSTNKRIHYNNLHPLVRVDSASSDDSFVSGDKNLRHSLPKFGKDKLCKMIFSHRSVPSTPADGSGSEGFNDILRRPRSYSARTDSSLSDNNEFLNQVSEKFQLSDGEEVDCDNFLKEGVVKCHVTQSLSESAICCLI